MERLADVSLVQKRRTLAKFSAFFKLKTVYPFTCLCFVAKVDQKIQLPYHLELLLLNILSFSYAQRQFVGAGQRKGK